MLFISCDDSIVHLYSRDRKKCITVIKESKEIRYMIDGYKKTIPKSNYIKIDATHVDKWIYGYEGCWTDGKYKWSLLLNPSEIILENKLDSTKFKIYNKFDKYDSPIKCYKDDNKGRFMVHYEYRKLISIYGDIIVEYVDNYCFASQPIKPPKRDK